MEMCSGDLGIRYRPDIPVIFSFGLLPLGSPQPLTPANSMSSFTTSIHLLYALAVVLLPARSSFSILLHSILRFEVHPTIMFMFFNSLIKECEWRTASSWQQFPSFAFTCKHLPIDGLQNGNVLLLPEAVAVNYSKGEAVAFHFHSTLGLLSPQSLKCDCLKLSLKMPPPPLTQAVPSTGGAEQLHGTCRVQ